MVCVGARARTFTDGRVLSDRLSFLFPNNRGKTRGQDKRRNKEDAKTGQDPNGLQKLPTLFLVD